MMTCGTMYRTTPHVLTCLAHAGAPAISVWEITVMFVFIFGVNSMAALCFHLKCTCGQLSDGNMLKLFLCMPHFYDSEKNILKK